MEDGLVPVMAALNGKATGLSLNPCCNGRWSSTSLMTSQHSMPRVLILVVMEDGLVHLSSARMSGQWV